MQEDIEKKEVVVREKFEQIESKPQKEEDEYDYENLIDVEAEDQQ